MILALRASLRRIVLLGCMVLAAITVDTAISPADQPDSSSAILAVKRNAANKMMQDMQYQDALALELEVVKADPGQYQDHVLLARLYEKLNRDDDAANEYRTILSLISAHTQDRLAAAARTTAEKSLKALDPLGGKIDATVDDFLKKLDEIEKEARAANRTLDVVRLYQIAGAVGRTEGRTEPWYCTALPGPGDYPSGYHLIAGHKYHVSVAGIWRTGPGLGTEANADGMLSRTKDTPPDWGRLEGHVGDGKGLLLGSEGYFVAPATGELRFAMHEVPDAARADNSGVLWVKIQEMP
jgi:tetratricopeptide (TPR) repeat protein